MEYLTINQIREWEAYNRIDPIGEWVWEFRFAKLEAIITNLAISIYGKKGTKYVEIKDFLPSWLVEEMSEIPQSQSVEDMLKVFKEIERDQNRKGGKSSNQPKLPPPPNLKKNG